MLRADAITLPDDGPNVPSEMWRMLASRSATNRLPKGLDAVWDVAVGQIVPLVPRRGRLMREAADVLALEGDYSNLSDARLRDVIDDLRYHFRVGRQTTEHRNHAFAVVREVAWRKLQMRPYLEQVAAGLGMYAGWIVEMATGEGKTLMATLPATVAGWEGRGCHIVTVNDYLAQRDADWNRSIFEFCGLRVAAIQGPMAAPERREAYNADVTYLTNKEAAADFLRDRLVLGRVSRLPTALLEKMSQGRRVMEQLVMRGLQFAIVDEADSVLIDEAVTPLIISGATPNNRQIKAFEDGAQMASQLQENRDFKIDQRYREIKLTPEGQHLAMGLAEPLGGIWSGARRRDELIIQALTASYLYQLEKHYVIQEDKIVIVDEFTGRLMPDRTWRDGLHQAVEAKEGLEVQPPKDTLARISFQRFFRSYRRLAGMTGTAWEGRHEFWRIYHSPTVKIPTHRPCVRREAGTRVFASQEAKWQAIADRIAEVHATGQPMLVGTRSVRASEHLSELLTRRGLDHEVLNAVRHKEEANIVAGAGDAGRITVATNMAGRGTDIRLGHGVTEKGGLHVIATERHESGRIDRQLFGRSGRQGDPGSAESFSSLEDELIIRYHRRFASHAGGDGERTGVREIKAVKVAQARAQSMSLRRRHEVLRTDDWLDEFLGFAGREA